MELIPPTLESSHLQSPSDFSRDRKLPFDKLFTFILSLTADSNNKGVDVKCSEFFKASRRSGLWPDAKSVHRSAVTKGRKKIPWQVFEKVHNDAVELAYEIWPDNEENTWNGKSVYAFDGAKFLLPATDEMRSLFDPNSGLEHEGKGHYPQCLVTTAYDVFRRFPVGRVVSPLESSEREVVLPLISKVPSGSILLFDRGYPGFEFFEYLNDHYDGDYLFRSTATSSFIEIEKFINSQKKEDVIMIEPSGNFIDRGATGAQRERRRKAAPIKLRVIRMQAPDGTLSVLLTSLLDNQRYSAKEIIKLYFDRWEVETYYRHEKAYIQLEEFHSRSVNGVLQELFASLIVSVIAATLMAIAYETAWTEEDKPTLKKSVIRLQLKNAVMTVASDAAFLAARDPGKAVEVFAELLDEIRRAKYYKPIIPSEPQPRVSLKPINKWTQKKQKRINGEL